MPTRRALLSLPLIGAAYRSARPARAEVADWRTTVTQVRFGISSSENERDAMVRYDRLVTYMTGKLGVPFHVFYAMDYAGVIEALRAEQLEFAAIGAANYALGNKVMGDQLAPLARSQDADGSDGYYSVIFVKADSPFQKIDDLRGHSMAFADPNSTSGYAFPSYYLKKQGYDPASFFSRTGFSGSHEFGVLAVLNGTYDAGATAWNNERRGNIQRMTAKRMIQPGSVRIIWKSPLIPNGPYVQRTALPQGLRDAFRAALFAMPKEDPAGFKAVTSDAVGLVPAKHEDYLDVIAVVRAVEAEHRHQG